MIVFIKHIRPADAHQAKQIIILEDKNECLSGSSPLLLQFSRVRSFTHFLKLTAGAELKRRDCCIHARPRQDSEMCVQSKLKQPYIKLLFPFRFVLFLIQVFNLPGNGGKFLGGAFSTNCCLFHSHSVCTIIHTLNSTAHFGEFFFHGCGEIVINIQIMC